MEQINWTDIFDLIMAVFEVKQKEIADKLNIDKTVLSKIKKGQRPTFEDEELYNKVFAPGGFPSKYEKPPKLLENLKLVIEDNFPQIKKVMSDYWNEENYKNCTDDEKYKSFVLLLLNRTRTAKNCSRAKNEQSQQIEDSNEPDASSSSFYTAQLHIDEDFKSCCFCSKWMGQINDELAACKINKDIRRAEDGKKCKYYEANEARIATQILIHNQH